jgi:hypothetical protein
MLRRASIAFVLIVCSSSLAADKPNMILIIGDDLGYADLSCQRGWARTSSAPTTPPTRRLNCKKEDKNEPVARFYPLRSQYSGVQDCAFIGSGHVETLLRSGHDYREFRSRKGGNLPELFSCPRVKPHVEP